MKLYLIRHGESEHGAKKIIAGWDDPALTELGKRQAHSAGKLLQEKNIDAIFSSDLGRVHQTALIIRDEIGRKIPVFSDWLLREKSFGDKEGLPWSHVDWERLSGDEIDYHAENNMESPDNFMKRTIAFLRNLQLLPHEYHNVAVVTSGGIMIRIEQIANPGNWDFDLNDKFANGRILEYDLNELLSLTDATGACRESKK
jgi:broad specificity phosphatase PhoE